VPATEFKAKCLELMDRVAERRETFVITKRGKPVAKMVPVDRKPKDSIFGWLRGKAWIKGDILSPVVPPEAWEVVEEWRELAALDEPPERKAPKRRSRRRSR
jgi:prevent-host-death family protein